MVGSSLAEGFTVSQEQSFAAKLPLILSRDTGHSIELYNEGMEWGTPRSIDLRFDDALAAKPDLILWPVTAIGHRLLECDCSSHAKCESLGNRLPGQH